MYNRVEKYVANIFLWRAYSGVLITHRRSTAARHSSTTESDCYAQKSSYLLSGLSLFHNVHLHLREPLWRGKLFSPIFSSLSDPSLWSSQKITCLPASLSLDCINQDRLSEGRSSNNRQICMRHIMDTKTCPLNHVTLKLGLTISTRVSTCL
jgi:hypothetical protein